MPKYCSSCAKVAGLTNIRRYLQSYLPLMYIYARKVNVFYEFFRLALTHATFHQLEIDRIFNRTDYFIGR